MAKDTETVPKNLPELTPTVQWAQRNDSLLLKINGEFKKTDFSATKDSLTFSGYPVDLAKVYKVTLNFKKDINSENIKAAAQGRYHDFTITKAEDGWWSQLLRDGKPHWLKVDFERWKDEDSEDEEGEENPGLGGGGGGDGGFGNMSDMFANLNSGAAGKPNFDDFEDEEKEDSDDEDIPNLE